MVSILWWRVGIAAMFALLSLVFLHLSYFFHKEHLHHKEGWLITAAFFAILLMFSSLPNVLFSIVVAASMFLILKKIADRSWKDAFNIWVLWIFWWLLLFVFLAFGTTFLKPFASF